MPKDGTLQTVIWGWLTISTYQTETETGDKRTFPTNFEEDTVMTHIFGALKQKIEGLEALAGAQFESQVKSIFGFLVNQTDEFLTTLVDKAGPQLVNMIEAAVAAARTANGSTELEDQAKLLVDRLKPILDVSSVVATKSRHSAVYKHDGKAYRRDSFGRARQVNENAPANAHTTASGETFTRNSLGKARRWS